MAYPKNQADDGVLLEQYRKHVKAKISLKPLFTTRLEFLGE
jgi:hypothetical protein